ncbi:MAG: helix-turn-helix domain-containing protein [Acetobacteraceae bacterium]
MSASRNSVAQQIEDLEDERDDYAARLARMESANQEPIPLSVIKRLSACEPPVRVWREHRGLSVQELSDVSGVPILTLHPIDMGEVDAAPLGDFAAIARALDVELDLVVPWTERCEPDSD